MSFSDVNTYTFIHKNLHVFLEDEKKVKWVKTTHGKPKAVHDHRAYTQDKPSKQKGKNWAIYECAQKRQRKCYKRITIDLDTSLIISEKGTHTCPTQIGLYESFVAKNMKKDAIKNGPPKKSAMEITREANRNLSQDSKDLLPCLDNQRRTISKLLQKHFPKHPRGPETLEDVPESKSTDITWIIFMELCTVWV